MNRDLIFTLIICIIPLLSVVSVNCQNPPTKTGSEKKIDWNDKVDKIDAFLKLQVNKGFSGSVLVSKNNEVLLSKGYGFANRESKTPNSADTLFEVASITKLYTVVAILQLAERGKLSVQDKIGNHLGKFEKPKDQATIHHLLLHTAGLVPRGYELEYGSRTDFVESIRKAPAESLPGEKYRYTNAGYTLLAALIEVASGMRYEDYLEKNIFVPLNLTNTTYWPNKKLKNLATGYTGGTLETMKPAITRESEWGDRGPSGIITNVGELHKFLIGLEGLKLVKEPGLQKMLTAQIEGEAYGFHVIHKPGIGKVLARGGGLPQFESQIAWYTDRNVKLIITINNRLRFRQPIWDEIERQLFEEK